MISQCSPSDNRCKQKTGMKDFYVKIERCFTKKSLKIYNYFDIFFCRYDTRIYTNESQPVIWAVGPVNSKVKFFSCNFAQHITKLPDWPAIRNLIKYLFHSKKIKASL